MVMVDEPWFEFVPALLEKGPQHTGEVRLDRVSHTQHLVVVEEVDETLWGLPLSTVVVLARVF